MYGYFEHLSFEFYILITIIYRYILYGYPIAVILTRQFGIILRVYLLAHRYLCMAFPCMNVCILAIIRRKAPLIYRILHFHKTEVI